MLSHFFNALTHTRNGSSVTLLSYHIPKTAGSSLRTMLENSYGNSKVHGVYSRQESNALTNGIPIEFDRRTRVLHGHFIPNRLHKLIYPQSQTVTWVRDPIERIWSLVGHLLRHNATHPQYKPLHEIYISKGISSREKIVYDLIKNNTIPHMVSTYARFFRNVPLSQIDFVGSVHKFEKDVSVLGNKLGKKLIVQSINVAPVATFPSSLKPLDRFMSGEYEIVSNYL